MKIACFLDTNTFLHYRQFDEIDWVKLLKADEVLLIVPSIVLRELDQKKFGSSDPKIRKRVAKVISKFASISKGEGELYSVRPGVFLHFCIGEPTVDWSAEGLSSEISDDRIVASIISQCPKGCDEVVLATADFGLTLKGRSKTIRCLELPRDLRLQVTKTAEEKEISELRVRLAKLEVRLPDLKLKINRDNEQVDVPKFVVQPPSPFNESAVDSEVDCLKKQLKYSVPQTKQLGNLAAILAGYAWPTKDEVERYERELEKYLEEYRSFAKQEWQHREFLSRCVELRFVLVNEGNSPAENINLFLYFPDGFELKSKEDMPACPEPPDKPTPPRTLVQKLTQIGTATVPYFPRIPDFKSPLFPEDLLSGPYIKRTKSFEVRYQIPKLQHGLQVELDPLFVVFDKIENAHSFHIDYAILADNLPEASKDKIAVVIETRL